MITDDGRGYAPEPDDDSRHGFTPPLPPRTLTEMYREPEPEREHEETDRDRVLKADRSARYERMIWRNGFLGLYAFGILMYAGWALTRPGTAWNLSAFVVLILGGLIPGLFLIARESGEREVEWNRVRPEPRSGAALPGLRQPLGSYPDDMLDGR
jgi:hypothetical protein